MVRPKQVLPWEVRMVIAVHICTPPYLDDWISVPLCHVYSAVDETFRLCGLLRKYKCDRIYLWLLRRHLFQGLTMDGHGIPISEEV